MKKLQNSCRARLKLLAVTLLAGLMGGCSLDQMLGDSSQSFDGGKMEQKPERNAASADALASGVAGQNSAVVLSYDYTIDVTLKSGMVLCKDGAIKLNIMDNLTFQIDSKATLKCLSAQLDIARILPPILNVLSQVGDFGSFAIQENVILAKHIPLMSGLSFDPGMPLFFVPTVGDDPKNSAGIHRSYPVSAQIAPNLMNIGANPGTTTLDVNATNTPVTTAGGKRYNDTVNWVIATSWQTPGLIPLPTLMDVTWSAAPIDLVGLRLELEINPKYLTAIEAMMNIPNPQPLSSGELDLPIGVVVDIHD